MFVLLELLCIYLVVNFNEKQSQISTHSGNRVVGTLYDYSARTRDYFNLTTINDSLAKDNAMLLAQLKNAQYDTQVERDTAYIELDTTQQQFTYIEARVINNSINRSNNSLTLNRGRADGVRPHMGVLSQDGLVGVVRNVSEHYSRVASLLHKQTRISASIKRNNFFGSLVWNERDPRMMNLVDVPRHAELRLGDTVLTSGYSVMFPKGFMIGIIEDFDLQSGSNYYDIRVRLTQDLGNIEYVYIVENLLGEELRQLEKEAADE
ncbi:MAG: rod shape-determining protein MreC [Bacteroidota bacterium]